MTEDEAVVIFDLGVEIGEMRALRRSRQFRLVTEFSQALTDGRSEDADRLRRQLLGELGREEGTE